MKVTGIQGEADEAVFSLKDKINNQDKRFDVLIRNGYEPDSPFFVAECRIDIGGSGAYWNDWYYRLHILRIKEKPTEQDSRNKATEKKEQAL